eukprot:scaffold30679_cov18-Tisochrysis_lutea.AAC.1
MGCFPQHTDMSACSYAQACGNCCSGLSWLLWDRDGPVDPAALRAELAAMPTEELTKMLEQMEENVQVRVVDGGNAQVRVAGGGEYTVACGRQRRMFRSGWLSSCVQ